MAASQDLVLLHSSLGQFKEYLSRYQLSDQEHRAQEESRMLQVSMGPDQGLEGPSLRAYNGAGIQIQAEPYQLNPQQN